MMVDFANMGRYTNKQGFWARICRFLAACFFAVAEVWNFGGDKSWEPHVQ